MPDLAQQEFIFDEKTGEMRFASMARPVAPPAPPALPEPEPVAAVHLLDEPLACGCTTRDHGDLGPWCPYLAGGALRPILAAARALIATPARWYRSLDFDRVPYAGFAHGTRGGRLVLDLADVGPDMERLGIDGALFLASGRDSLATAALWVLLCRTHQQHPQGVPFGARGWVPFCEWDGRSGATHEGLLARVDATLGALHG